MNTKKKGNKTQWIIIAALGAVLAGAIALLVALELGAFSTKEKTPQETTLPTTTAETTPAKTSSFSDPTTTAGDTQPEVTGPENYLAISTPYGPIYISDNWEGLLKVDQIAGDPYQVIFTADLAEDVKQDLFTLYFGGKAEGSLGGFRAADGKLIPVRASTVEIRPQSHWTSDQTMLLQVMQEELNDVLEMLKLEQIPEDAPVSTTTAPAQTTPPPTPTTTAPPQTTTQTPTTPPSTDPVDFAIDTPYCELHYPAKWASELELAVDDSQGYSVAFYGKVGGSRIHLFTVYFGGSQGIFVKTIQAPGAGEVEVRIDISELTVDDAWSDADARRIFAMQEDMNYLLSKLPNS